MATRLCLVEAIQNGVLQVTWTGLLNGDDGAPFDGPMFADKTVTVFGTFGAGGSVTIQGRPSFGGAADAQYTALNDSRGEGNALTFTAPDTRLVNENTSYTRPIVTAGDGTTNLTVCILARTRP